MTNISQSKYQNRGPLIAVIKIQLNPQNVDRIFLHLKDNDQELAQQFVHKHSLNPMLKKHIFQRIQISRQAVDKSKLNPVHDNQENQDNQDNNQHYQNYQNDSFTTPMPKKDLLFQQSSTKKPTTQKPQQQKQKPHPIHSKPHITYDNSSSNDTFEQRYHGSFQHTNHKLIQQQKRHKHQQHKKDLFAIKQHPNRQLNQLVYTKDKYKNLYDVSGLKLKSSYPSISNDHSLQASSKYHLDQYASSQSSQGLFEKEMSNEKVLEASGDGDFFHESIQKELGNDLKRKHSYSGHNGYHYDPQAFRKQRVPQFHQVTEQRYAQYKPFNPSLYDKQTNPKVWRHHQMNNIAVDKSQNAVRKPFTAISKENQTKFSSIEKSSQTDFMDLNYISFNKPYNQVLSNVLPTKLAKATHYQREPFQNDDQLFGNSLETQSKRVGSIRSNGKNYNEAQNSIKSNHEITYNNETFTPHSDLETTTKFNQQKLFSNIKDIHNTRNQQIDNTRNQQIDNTRNLQQNRQINTQTTRPTVKFYNKQEMKSLKQSTLSKSISRSQLSRINTQVTNRLYNQADIKKKYLETLRARAKNLKEEELQSIQELRQKPQINMLSKLLAENRIKENKKLQDYLIDQGKIFQLKRQQMTNRQARKILQECSFRPQINQESQRLSVLQRSRSKSRISNHSQIKFSKRTYNNESTFHPEINKLSNEIAKGKGTFNERQNAFLEEKNNNIFKKMQEQRMKQKTDQTSGQRLFQPQLTQRTLKIAKQSVQKHRQNKPIHSYLYQLSKIPHKQYKIDQRPSINPQSQKMIQQLQQKRLNWLFLQLDNDQDGIISSKGICIDQIPTQILEIIAPVLYEMQQLNTELNIDDFKGAIKNLNKALDPYQKSLLYNYNHSAKMIRT